MSTKRIVVTAPIDNTATDILQQIAPIETSPSPDEETLRGFCGGTIVFISRGAVTGRARTWRALDDRERATTRPSTAYAIGEGQRSLVGRHLIRQPPLVR